MMETNRQYQVLIIEGDPKETQRYRAFLENGHHPPYHQFVINSTDHLKQGIQYLEHKSGVDLILLDLSLPDSSGIETYNKLSAVAKDIPVIILAEPVQKLSALRAIKKGARDFLIKNEINAASFFKSVRHAMEIKNMETGVHSSGETVQKLTDTIPVMLWIAKSDGQSAYFNQSWLDFTGRTLEQEVGLGWFESIHPDDVGRCQDIYYSAVKTRYRFRVEFRLKRCDGVYRWMLSTGVPCYSLDREILGYVCSCIDITELKQAEKTLQYRVDFERLVASLSTNFINMKVDEIDKGFNNALEVLGRFAQVDRSYIFLFSDDREKMSNVYEWCREEIEEEKEFLQEIPLKKYPWIIDRLLQFETIYLPNIKDLPLEAANERAEFNREKIKSLINVPLVLRNSVIGFIGFDSVRQEKAWDEDIISLLKIAGEMFVNALERKHNEDLLRQSEGKLQMFVQQAPAAIAMFDRDIRYLAYSPQWIETYRLPNAELVGKSFYEIAPESFDKWQKVFGRVLEGTVEKCEEDCFESTDGVVEWIRWEIHPWYESAGKVGGVVMFAEDVTKSKRAEVALVESEKRLRSYFNISLIGMAIISPMKGWLEVNDKLCEILGYSREELTRMTWVELTHPEDLVKDFELFDKVLAGKVDSYSLDKRFIRKDGDVIYARQDIRCIRKPDGAVDYLVAVIQDVTEKVRSEEERRESEEKYRELYNSNRDGICLHDLDGNILDANPATLAMLGYSLEEIKKMNCHELTPHKWYKFEEEIIKEQVMKRGYSDIYEKELIRKDGVVFPVEVRIWVTRDEWGNPLKMWRIVRDVTRERKSRDQLDHLAYHDRLTDLPSRPLFMDRLNQSILSAKHSKIQIGILFIGMDHFKRVNDHLGHSVGDRLLQTVARRIKNYLHETETIARIGGDEFAILLPRVRRTEEAVKVAGNILHAFEAPFLVDEHELFMSASTGISFFPVDGKEPEELLRNAATAMSRAKKAGRNNFKLYSPAVDAKTSKALEIENELRYALERNELRIHFQPQVDLKTEKISGVEALIRWQHPRMGLLSPADFLPVAHETGLITSIDDWVLRQACAQNKRWQELGLPDIKVAVNLTAHQFQNHNLVEAVHYALGTTGIQPSQLEFELTEGTIIQNTEETAPVLSQLTAMGVQISIDDFGTGYSSLSYLRKFPIHTLKIDQSFVRDITIDESDAAIVKAIISLAHDLKLKVVAEAVETRPQLDFLRAQDCDRVQGFLFSKPLPADTLTEMLTNGFRMN